MIKEYLEIYKAQWNFFIHYGWKIALVMIIISAIVILIMRRS